MASTITLKTLNNGDDVYLAWKASGGAIDQCLGFGIECRRPGKSPTFISNRMGFAIDAPKSGDRRPSDQWPFQAYRWSDHAADLGAQVSYRVVAMCGTPGHLQPGPASDWTPVLELQDTVSEHVSCHFNRGYVLSQFIARVMKENHIDSGGLKAFLKGEQEKKLARFLAGNLGSAIEALLARVKSDPSLHVYAALYELDEDMSGLLAQLGARAHVVLSNASAKSRTSDPNGEARKVLEDAQVDKTDRMCAPKFLGHNKFLVVAQGPEDDPEPLEVWTGSMNWTFTGRHTQLNNAVHIVDASLAARYLEQWRVLKIASEGVDWQSPGAGTKWKVAGQTVTLAEHNAQPYGPVDIDAGSCRAWFTRTQAGRDIDDLVSLVKAARQSVLAIMFNAGEEPLQTIVQRMKEGLYVRAVVNQIPKGAKEQIRLLDGSSVGRFSSPVVQPEGVHGSLGAWVEEVSRKDFLANIGFAITHSKVIIVDAMSDHPVVITGSHNFSSNASGANDENFLVIEGHKSLAQAYATHCLTVYNHYRWRQFQTQVKDPHDATTGFLKDNAGWQSRRNWQTTKADMTFMGL
jgi:hypothetical protein